MVPIEGGTFFRPGVVLAVEVVAVGEQGVFGSANGSGDDVWCWGWVRFVRIADDKASRRRDRW